MLAKTHACGLNLWPCDSQSKQSHSIMEQPHSARHTWSISTEPESYIHVTQLSVTGDNVYFCFKFKQKLGFNDKLFDD